MSRSALASFNYSCNQTNSCLNECGKIIENIEKKKLLKEDNKILFETIALAIFPIHTIYRYFFKNKQQYYPNQPTN